MSAAWPRVSALDASHSEAATEEKLSAPSSDSTDFRRALQPPRDIAPVLRGRTPGSGRAAPRRRARDFFPRAGTNAPPAPAAFRASDAWDVRNAFANARTRRRPG